MRCLIVDDEPLARQLICGYVERLPFLTLVDQCDNAFRAIELLSAQDIDLVFLDIELPNLNGFDMLRSLASPPQVIVITAHRDYAIQGFDLDVVDFLLKPYGFDRFLRAVHKAMDKSPPESSLPSPPAVFVKDGKRMHQVRLEDLWWIEAAGNYCVLHTVNGQVICQDGLAQVEKMLPGSSFIRVHKSHIVAVAGIEWIESQVVGIHGKEVPVGRTYRKALEERVRQRRNPGGVS